MTTVNKTLPLPNGHNFTLSVSYSEADAAGINVSYNFHIDSYSRLHPVRGLVKVLVAVSTFSLIGVIILLGAIAVSIYTSQICIDSNPHFV